jgi:hypothetical protein
MAKADHRTLSNFVLLILERACNEKSPPKGQA